MCHFRPRRKWRLCVLIGLLALPLLLKLLSSYASLPTLVQLTELEKCPTCFGVTMCPAFMGGQISLNGFDGYSKLMNVVGSKNVMYGLYRGEKVVLKKLGHDWELRQLDERVCGELDFGSGCQVNEAVWRIDDLRSAIARRLAPVLGHPESPTGMRLCPTARNVDRLLDKVVHRNRGTDARILDANIWTLLLINPEPLVLQMLPEEENWPVPRYYGACGRVVIEEYAGEILSSYFDAPWLFRAKLSLQLLTAAAHFTERHPDFGFYLTDVSPENLAVDPSGRLKFVDLEHVVVVDRHPPPSNTPPSWDSPHTTEAFPCDGCLAFSVADICSHRTSDHNYYAVCQHLLAADAPVNLVPGGLLNGIPAEVLDVHRRLPEMLRECARPTGVDGRLKAARELMHVLANVTAANP